jgi:hypothetical protein
VNGTIISDIQLALNAAGSNLTPDLIYGTQTAAAVSSFQGSHRIPVTGNISETTWNVLMRTDEPPIFARCLQVVASFEGTGFSLVVGNFDGAGITWGIVGFTLVGGELGQVLRQINQSYPDLIGKAFGSDATEIMDITDQNTTSAEKTAWANSISRGSKNYNVADPWRTYFHDLGSYREVQRIQVARARDIYWKIASKDVATLELGDELDYLLLFDIAVQNGGMGRKGRVKLVQEKFAQDHPKTARDKRLVIANVVADTSAGFQADVLARKTTIANGKGTVHDGQYDLGDWGLLDGRTPGPALTS